MGQPITTLTSGSILVFVLLFFGDVWRFTMTLSLTKVFRKYRHTKGHPQLFILMTCYASLQTWKMLTRGFFATPEKGGTNHTEFTASDCHLCLKNNRVLLCLTLLFRQYFWTHSIVTFVPAPRKCLLFWWRISLSRLQPCSECHLAPVLQRFHAAADF